jgi:poly(hydroxyalkanoate) depolymerase family esterase
MFMRVDIASAMRRAATFTRAYKIVEATRIIQDALAGRGAAAGRGSAPPNSEAPEPEARPTLRLVSPDADTAETSAAPEPSFDALDAERIGVGRTETLRRARRPLGEVLQALRGARPTSHAFSPLPGINPRVAKAPALPPAPEGAQFLTRSFVCAAGSRNYKLYIPASAADQPRGLVVMLHGCKQDSDDFAAGTNMNAIAEAHGLVVAYPHQSNAANPSSCWNWFNPADQARDAGEPAIISGLTRDIMSEFGLGRRQVFVAGLSAGGAMAAVLAETYPDLYAAVGIHSGLAYKAANDVISAFAAMRGHETARSARPRAAALPEHRVRTIIFQGSADRTVHPSNADGVVAAAAAQYGLGEAREESSRSIGGRICTRTVIASLDGVPLVEYWLVNGAGHAWSGGRPSGSYTDEQGPDASAEMVRFFLNQPET